MSRGINEGLANAEACDNISTVRAGEGIWAEMMILLYMHAESNQGMNSIELRTCTTMDVQGNCQYPIHLPVHVQDDSDLIMAWASGEAKGRQD